MSLPPPPPYTSSNNATVTNLSVNNTEIHNMTVVNCPKQHLAFTNRVYISSSDAKKLLCTESGYFNRLSVNGFVFNVEEYPWVKPGLIGLNRSQRGMLGVEADGIVEVHCYKDKPETLKSLQLQLEFVQACPNIVKLSDIVRLLFNLYQGQIFTFKQKFVEKLLNLPLELTVTDLTIIDDSVKNEESKENAVDIAINVKNETTIHRGMLMDSTTIDILPPPCKIWQLEQILMDR